MHTASKLSTQVSTATCRSVLQMSRGRHVQLMRRTFNMNIARSTKYDVPCRFTTVDNAKANAGADIVPRVSCAKHQSHERGVSGSHARHPTAA